MAIEKAIQRLRASKEVASGDPYEINDLDMLKTLTKVAEKVFPNRECRVSRHGIHYSTKSARDVESVKTKCRALGLRYYDPRLQKEKEAYKLMPVYYVKNAKYAVEIREEVSYYMMTVRPFPMKVDRFSDEEPQG